MHRALIPMMSGLILAMGWAPSARAAWRVEDVQPVTKGGAAMAPVMAPDGRRVAYFVGTRQTVPGGPDTLNGRLWILDRGAGQAARVGRLNTEAVQGEQVAAFATGGGYAYVEGPRAAPILWYVDGDRNRFRVGAGRSAAFSPDGKYLAYTAWSLEGGPALEVWLFDTGRHESKRLVRVLQKQAPAAVDAPRWMPDAAKILFRSGDDLYAYARYTGRLEGLTRTDDVRAFDIGPGGVIWYYRNGRDRDAAGLWTARPDGKAAARAFRADELPADIAGLTAGPDADTVLFIGGTAAGRGLVAADMRDGRWRYLAAADAFTLRSPGDMLAMESPEGAGKRNIRLGRLVPDAARAAR